MRRLVIRSVFHASMEQATRLMIKYKVNAILVTDEEGNGMGVLSKTDVMTAYYAEMSIDTPIEVVMSGPPLFCNPEDALDEALEMMRGKGVHRLYVAGEMPARAVGVLAYPDIVGILYRYCYKCEKSLARRRSTQSSTPETQRLKVHEVMTPSVHTHSEDETLFQVMEGLSSHCLGAALITANDARPLGIISKTDLIIAFRHHVAADVPARSIMSTPVIACSHGDFLGDAIQTMIFSDVHRLFVYGDDTRRATGVLSLTDAARIRSGTCRACMATRVVVGAGAA